MPSSFSLLYSSSLECSPSFSMSRPTFHIFLLTLHYISPSPLQNFEHSICDFAQEHAIVLHFETKHKVSDDIKLLVEVLVFPKIFWHWSIFLTLEVFHFNFCYLYWFQFWNWVMIVARLCVSFNPFCKWMWVSKLSDSTWLRSSDHWTYSPF